jgi:membrane-bound metal-dependent hydrolase YbcI (DUF457 family)
MPFTPFHFGPGLALKGITRHYFSWSAFAAAQVFIDCETLYHFLRHEDPFHRFFHSFLGGATAGLMTSILLLLFVRAIGRMWPKSISLFSRSVPYLTSEFAAGAVFVGGLAGGLSHPLLDGIVHRDVRPFMPFSDYNPFLHLISSRMLESACLIAAFLGILMLAWDDTTFKPAGQNAKN